MQFSNMSFEFNSEFIWRLFIFLCVVSVVLASSDAAFAAGGGQQAAAESNDVIGVALCRLVQNLSGGVAKGIATIAIFSVGVGLFLGKLNWGIAAATTAGVAIIFSAPKMVGFLTGDADNATCPVQ